MCSYGSVVSSNAVLTVTPPVAPAITTQPANATVTAGGSATFTVVASGSLPLSFQWRFNETNLTGETSSSLTLNNVQTSQAGNYSVVVTNIAGSAISSNAVLTVNFPPATVRVVGTNFPPSSTVTVPVQLVANGNEYALSFSLNFPYFVLAYNSVALGSGAMGASLVVNTNQVGSGHLGVQLFAPPSTTFAAGTEEILQVTFTVVNPINSTSGSISFGNQPVSRQLVDAMGAPLAANFLSGIIYVAPASGYEADVSPLPNGDRAVTLSDWFLIGRFAARLDYPTNATIFQRADCAPRASQGDGQIAVTDWVQAGRYANGLDLLTPAGGPNKRNRIAASWFVADPCVELGKRDTAPRTTGDHQREPSCPRG